MNGNINRTKTLHIACQLPISSTSGMIPVNAQNERLDVYMNPPTTSQWNSFNQRMSAKKLCTQFYLRPSHACTRGACTFDHTPINSDTLYCLQYVLRSCPCVNQGKCRLPGCYNGHVCQNISCAEGKVAKCGMAHTMHSMDCNVAKWVCPDDVTTVDGDTPAVVQVEGLHKELHKEGVRVQEERERIEDFESNMDSEESDDGTGYNRLEYFGHPKPSDNVYLPDNQTANCLWLNDDLLGAAPPMTEVQANAEGLEDAHGLKWDENTPLIDL
jgi:hypothetical protein